MSNGELLVIGHRNPDTDAICSAIGYAEFKRRTGWPSAEAARCGETNERIDFVLQTFGMAAPRFVTDVSPKVRDVMQRDLVSVSASATVGEALSIMDQKGIRVLPVLDEDSRVCRGLVSVFKMVKFLTPTTDSVFDSRRVFATPANIARTLGAEMISMLNPDAEEDLILMVAAMNADSFAERLAQSPHERLVVAVGDRRKIQSLAISGRVRMVIVTGGLPVDQATIEEAKKQGVSLIISPHDTATTAMLCRSAICVRNMMHEDFLTFREDEPLAEIEPVAADSTFQTFPIVDNQGRTVGVLSKSDFLKKVNRRLILVDHNELSQAVSGADQVEILEIIDHHRLGALTTTQPILFRNEPVGSTSTIVADCFFRNGLELPSNIAGLLLAGLVSDTLNLTSPTTTERDADILRKLEKISGVKANEFIEKLFASGSVLTSLSAAQAIVADCKEFEQDGRTFSIAQIEELGFDQFWRHKGEVSAALEKYRAEKNYFFSVLLITDVARNTSLLLVAGPPHFLKSIDYPAMEPCIFELKDVVSRKKQVLPYLTQCLRKGPAKRPYETEPNTIV